MEIEFFMSMRIPTITQQMHKVMVRNGKPIFYEPPELKTARQKFEAYLAQHRPEHPIDGAVPIRLITKWIFAGDKYGWKITKPDTDNMIKMFKDCMTAVGFWKDDCQVCSEITEKFYGEHEGIYVGIKTMEDDDE